MLYTLEKVGKEALKSVAEEKRVRKTNEIFLLFSLGSQFDHLIKQEIEKLGVFCLVADPEQVTAEDVKKVNPIGIILSGGPVSIYEDLPPFDHKIFNLGIPVLGICLGFQLWAKHIGVNVINADKREFGTHTLIINEPVCLLFKDCEERMPVLYSHGDIVTEDNRLSILASTSNSPVAAANYNHLWGVQFHPEVTETIYGPQMFESFCFRICGAKDRFPVKEVAKRKIGELREQIGDKKVILALSGGSDSSTAAYLVKYAQEGKNGQIGARYIKGIDRPDDEAHVLKYFSHQDWLDLKIVDATDRFLKVLKGIESMHEKRVAMRAIYKAVLEEEAGKFGANYIVQGTLYTDISESGHGYTTGARKARIKLHHNVGLDFSCEEILPLSDCVKDSGRSIGREIGVPEELLTRHPFPGPGMVVRIEGAITKENLKISRAIDEIWIEELRKWDLYHKVWQAGTFVTRISVPCTKGDDAVSGMVILYWAVWSVNGFTATAAELPWDFLKYVDRRMGNEVREVGRVCYSTSSKPYATIEFG